MVKVYLVLDGSKQPELIPDDFFYRNGWSIMEWLEFGAEEEDPDLLAQSMADRCFAYARAHALFLEASSANKDELRHEPWVIPEYDSLNNAERYLFVFKCENNGNTYRVRYEAQ